MKEFTARENDADMRLSRFVQRVTKGLPDPAMYKSFRNKRIKVNGKRAAPDYRLRQGDLVQLYINDEFFAGDAGAAPSARVRLPQPGAALPAYGTVYQDEGLAILYKSAGVLSHRGEGDAPALLDAFTAALVEGGEYTPGAENTFAPALCNRLDRGTEGLVVAAKRAATLRDMNEVIRKDLLGKSYLCACVGTPPEGRHQAFLRRERATHTVRVSDVPDEDAKPITTGVRVLEEHGGLALCEIDLLTGRTHQIRAHLAHLGTPVLGDAKYGDAAANRRVGRTNQALCAWQLSFAAGLPPHSSLAHLAGRAFTAEDHAQLPAWWQQWKQRPLGSG